MDRIILEIDANIALKQYIISDSEAIFKLIDNDRSHLSQHGDTTAQKYPTLESVRNSIVNPENTSRLRFGIWDRDVFVGTINITPNEDTLENPIAEVGYFLGEDYQGKGYIGKSLERLIQYAFSELNIQMVYATVARGNNRSANVFIRAGFRENNIPDDQRGFYLERN
ncbi:MAG: acetyltransferase related protein [uncultured bacterium]|nr:MAG: acetyltransferase related protein [uncultured bacterium]HBR79993.1 hypothetical protein [Candidatus Moranbacteria bacterium]